MKRATKIVLAAVGLPALCSGLFWLDSYARAVGAVRAENARLEKDIAAWRSRRPVMRSRLKAQTRLEDSRPGTLVPECMTLMGSRGSPTGTADELIAAIDASLAGFEECGIYFVDQSYFFHSIALEMLRERFIRGASSKDLRTLASALDRQIESRIPIREILEAQLLIERAEVLRVLHRKADPTKFITRPPGWRDFFSWHITAVKAVAQLDDRYRRLQEIDVASVEEWRSRARTIVESLEDEPMRTRSRWVDAPHYRMDDARTQAMWRFTRATVALALFHAEQGREAARLEELVPKYLPELPVHPWDGSPLLEYEDGLLKVHPLPWEGWMDWTLRSP